MIVEGGGVFPKKICDLRKVRGIGEYTAGAIASIAFKEVRNFCRSRDIKKFIFPFPIYLEFTI